MRDSKANPSVGKRNKNPKLSSAKAKPSQDELEKLKELVESVVDTFQFGTADQEPKEEELGEMENKLLDTLDQLVAHYSDKSLSLK